MSLNSIKNIQTAYKKIYENAVSLLEESKILYQNQKFARSFFLAHTSIEEFGRLVMLASAAMQIKAGVLNIKELNRRLRSHKVKIRLSYSYIEILKQYKNPLSNEDKINILLTAMFQLLKMDNNYIERINKQRNGALYADNYNNTFKAPSEIINESKSKELINYAEMLKEIILPYYIDGVLEELLDLLPKKFLQKFYDKLRF